MSRAEVQRFATDLKSNATLRHEVDNITRDPMPSVVNIARQRGYDFTVDEAKAFIRGKSHAAGKPMSDSDLDRVAGGAGPIDSIGGGLESAGKAVAGGLESAGKTIAGWFHL